MTGVGQTQTQPGTNISRVEILEKGVLAKVLAKGLGQRRRSELAARKYAPSIRPASWLKLWWR